MTQEERVLKYLEEFNSINALQALRDCGVFRLSARIYNLRQDGHDIETKRVNVTNRYGEQVSIAEYHLTKPIER